MSESGMRLKVKPEELLTVSAEVEEQVRTLRQQFARADGIVKRSSHYWEGQGQMAYVRSYQTKYDRIENALRLFSGNVNSLRTIAGVYSQTEAQVTEMANSLSEDVIV